ncbi:PulJ/GspJ family protein [Deinococcus enclensis]|uniref:Prepilin-type N-terminal cleavage/methylation domain-containing protein n=1 Tax=Deinococcus enclensis TaxID=1049582 RepID=A0ABT9ME07_9DEIO|nr:type II secretion system protein [Deinococcus enclensis]MDP9764827.1 prepilin-type N-terminal cleavage/methylation domain-containing protein [Deinococcus enclensis]
MKRTADGFTVVEILVAIAVFGVLAAVLTTTLVGSLDLNRRSQQSLDATSRAQLVMEGVRGAWNLADSMSYDRACAPTSVTVPAGVTVQYQNLDSRGEPLNALRSNVVFNANCAGLSLPAGTVVPRMRRIIVSTGTGAQDVTLELDVLRPQP